MCGEVAGGMTLEIQWKAMPQPPHKINFMEKIKRNNTVDRMKKK